MPKLYCTQCHALKDIALVHDEVRDFGNRQCAECHNHKCGAPFGESGQEHDED